MCQATFSERQRLITPSQYSRVFSEPVKFYQSGFTVLCRSNTENMPRLGLAISKKKLPHAVDRNRVKRLARESFRTQLKNKAVDIVLLARNPIINMDNTQILKQLNWLWHKINQQDW